MIRLLKFLIFGDAHLHKWVSVEKLHKTTKGGDVVAVYYICKCEVCGSIKRFST